MHTTNESTPRHADISKVHPRLFIIIFDYFFLFFLGTNPFFNSLAFGEVQGVLFMLLGLLVPSSTINCGLCAKQILYSGHNSSLNLPDPTPHIPGWS